MFHCILSKLLVMNRSLIKAQSLIRPRICGSVDFKLAGNRGTIYSRRPELAVTYRQLHFIVVPAMIEEPEHAADVLSQILNTDRDALYKKLTNHVSTQKPQPEGQKYQWWNRRWPFRMRILKASCLFRIPSCYYPNGYYLAQVLGFTGIDNQGLAGLELEYGWLHLSAKNGDLKPPPWCEGKSAVNYRRGDQSRMGMDMVLTIDPDDSGYYWKRNE